MASNYTLGVTVVGNASEFEKSMDAAAKKIDKFKEQLNSNSFSKVGSALQQVGGKISSFGSSLTSKITKPALVATGALAGLTLVKGWQRFAKIDEAKAKLSALGNSAKDVKSIMNNALESVKSTAFNLDEAAGTAAAAVAAGIKPGKDLQGYLSSVADAAAIAGTSMEDMGNVFNKVATKGKASNEELKMLAEKGIPIYQYLAEATGKTTDEVFKLAESGQIDLATFRKAVEDNIGGAAKAMGSQSLSGAISNVKAAIGRIGANLFGESDQQGSMARFIIDELNNITAKLEPIEAKAKKLGLTIGQVATAAAEFIRTGAVSSENALTGSAARVFEKLQPILTFIQNLKDRLAEIPTSTKLAFGGVLVAAGPVITIFGKLISVIGTLSKLPGQLGAVKGLFSGLGGGLGQIVSKVPLLSKLPAVFGTIKGALSAAAGPIAAVVAGFILMFKNSEAFRGAIGGLVSAIGSMFKPVIESLKEPLKAIWEAIGAVAGVLGDTLAPVIKTITPLFKVLSIPIKIICTVISKLITLVAKLITWFATKLGNIKKSVDKTFGPLKKIMGDPIGTAKDFILKAVDKIKEKFAKLKLKLPHIKLPHFSITGKFSLKPPSIPHISVDWYAKGGIISSPGVIGVGDAPSPEAVVPLDRLQGFINKAVAGSRTPGTETPTNVYNINARFDVSKLKDVLTAEKLFELLTQANAF